jgi:glycosyltransferase involved in cell wall biosynthesis
VAVVAPPYYDLPPRTYGGTELVCHVLAEALVDRGHDVTLIGAGRATTRARFVATHAEAQPEGTPDAPRIELVHAARAAAAIADAAVDVVHDHTRMGPLTAPGRPPPTVLTVHSALAGPDAALVELEAVQAWVHPVAISATQRATGPGIRWCATVHNGLPLDRYPAPAAKDDFVLYLGRISRHKGVHLAVEAARRAGRRLVIAGGPSVPEERAYLDDCVRPRLGAGAEWIGEVDFATKVELLHRARCLLFPARWHEPFGLALVEAMACGTPVVGLRIGAVPELVVDGVAGVVCDRVDELPAAIERAGALDPHACRAHAARFSAARMAAAYEDVYRAVLR